MNPFLLSLLGPQAATSATEFDPTNIEVGMSPGTEQDPAILSQDVSAPNSQALMAVQQDVANAEDASDRRGLFGVRGTLRDVLGVVGDAFLMQSGRGPMYAPVRRQEQISDAMAGFSESPQAMRAAAERVGYYDADMGRELLEKAKAAELAGAANQLKGRTEDRQAFDDATKRISQLYASVVQNPTPENAAYALQLAKNESQTLGIPLEQLGVTPNMTEDVMRILAGRGATVSQTMNLPLAERRVEISEEKLGLDKQRLGIALRGVKDREKRTQIAERVLGLRRDDQRFDQMIELLGLQEDFVKASTKEGTRSPRATPRAAPTGATRTPSVSNW